MTASLKRQPQSAQYNGTDLPAGMTIVPLESHGDSRGSFTEIFRNEWRLAIAPIQWNVVKSRAQSYRGFHVHHRHSDYMIVVEGEMLLGVHDIREDSRTAGLSAMLRLSGNDLCATVIPPGVGHGFYYPQPSLHIYAVSEYWDPSTEMGCHWSCRELGLDWPMKEPLISARDAGLGSYDDMVQRYRVLATDDGG